MTGPEMEGALSQAPRGASRARMAAALAFVAIAGAGLLSGVTLDRYVLTRGAHGWRGGKSTCRASAL